MTNHRDWTGKVGTVWAQEWRRTDRSFRELTPILLEAIEARDFASLIDIGCGAGEIACTLAARHSQASLLGVDIAPDLLDVARERGAGLPNLGFVHGDAASVDLGRDPPADLLVSRHGVMFFGDPVAAFTHLRTQAAVGAGLVFSCFRERRENKWVGETLSALPAMPPAPADPREPGPFAFGSRDYVHGILRDAGWEDVAFAPVDFRMTFGEGTDPVADACDYLTRVGPTATPISQLEGDDRKATLERLTAILSRHVENGAVALPAAAWIVTARAPA